MAVNLKKKENKEIKSEGIIELYLGGTTLNEQIQIGTCPDGTDMTDTGFKFGSVNSETSTASYVYEIDIVNKDNETLRKIMEKIHQYKFLEKINKIDKLELSEQGKEKVKKLIKDLKKYYKTQLKNDKFGSYSKQYLDKLSVLDELCNKFKLELDKSVFFDKNLHGKIEEDKLDEMMKKSIAAQIIKDAMINWGDAKDNDEAEEIINKAEDFEDFRKNVTQNSDINAIDGMCKICGLTKKESEELKYQISTSDKISKRLAEKIKNKMQENPYGAEGSILEILSYVHDEWCINHPNNFLMEGRDKEYQFVKFLLLDWKEAAKDLVFLKPILKACGIEINEAKIERVFLEKQRKFLKERGLINDSGNVNIEQLEIRLAEGANFYPTLKGLKTNRGNDEGKEEYITDCLFEEKDKKVYSIMAEQVAEQIAKCQNKDRKELIKKELIAEFKIENPDEEKVSEIAEVMAEIEKNTDLTNEIFADIMYKMHYNSQKIKPSIYLKEIREVQEARNGREHV